jgi:hypothetical protein
MPVLQQMMTSDVVMVACRSVRLRRVRDRKRNATRSPPGRPAAGLGRARPHLAGRGVVGGAPRSIWLRRLPRSLRDGGSVAPRGGGALNRRVTLWDGPESPRRLVPSGPRARIYKCKFREQNWTK